MDIKFIVKIVSNLDELIEYKMALENMLSVFKGELGKIGEYGNSLRRLKDKIDKIVHSARSEI